MKPLDAALDEFAEDWRKFKQSRAGNASVLVRGLRHAFGDTQTQFALRLGYSLPTIQRWETLVPPRGRALVDLAACASRSGFSLLALDFRTAFFGEFGNPCEFEWNTEEDTLS